MEVADDVCEAEGVCEVLCDSALEQPEQEESMDTHVRLADVAADLPSNEEHVVPFTVAPDTINTSDEPQKARFSYRVPTTVCFGHGSVRGFRGRRGRKK